MFSPSSLIAKKNNKKEFLPNEIEFIIDGYTNDDISDDVMSLWLKAVYNHGMSYEETLTYTRSMINSGVKLDFSHLNGYVVDKHSTGGVGDKVSLVLAPLLAACNCYVPMLAGRGLEHTGGTIDKLETIPGYNSSLDIKMFSKIVEKIGVSIMSQTKEICPADRKIYRLRDITSTVASLPLICGSIMSKKIAEGIKGLVLDIKVGNGAFMKTIKEAQELGDLLKKVGQLYGLEVSICLTNMHQPLGKKAGLWCEVMESIDCLKGGGPDDLMEIVYHLGSQALKLSGENNPLKKLQTAILDGSALNTFKEMIERHGGSASSLDLPDLHSPKYINSISSTKSGYIYSINTHRLGMSLTRLGGGCIQKDDVLDPSVGMVFHKKVGDSVKEGDILMEYFCSNKNKFDSINNIHEVYEIKSSNLNHQSMVY